MSPIEEDLSLTTKSSPCPALPNFLIVGAPKTGTTSLYHYLKQHPEIFMSPIKEPSFFCTELRPKESSSALKLRIAEANELRSHLLEGKCGAPPPALITEWDDYQLLFRNVRAERAVGEASVCYLWSVSAPCNIRLKLPHAKIIMILRDPAERAFSHYLHILSAGSTKVSFREHIDRWLRGSNRDQDSVSPFLEFGLYYEQVKRYFDLFARGDIRIYWYDEAWQEPALLLANLFEFLNVGSFELDSAKRHLDRPSANMNYLLAKYGLRERAVKVIPRPLRSYLKPLAFRFGTKPRLAANDRRFLVDYYRNDIEKLAILTNRDLSAWLS